MSHLIILLKILQNVKTPLRSDLFNGNNTKILDAYGVSCELMFQIDV